MLNAMQRTEETSVIDQSVDSLQKIVSQSDAPSLT